MATQAVTFIYLPGVYGDAFPHSSATLEGGWNGQGFHSEDWSVTPMEKIATPDGGRGYQAVVHLDDSQKGQIFHWGVRLHHADTGDASWAIVTEVNDTLSTAQECRFLFDGTPSTQRYFLTIHRHLGANKRLLDNGQWGAVFRTWAPNARQVDLVFGCYWDANDSKRIPAEPGTSLDRKRIGGGYIADDGNGIHPQLGTIAMKRDVFGIWETPADDDRLKSLSLLEHRFYMFRVTRDDGSVLMRSDIYSRCQSGSGNHDPQGSHYAGLLSELEGRVSCSVTVDPEKVVGPFETSYWPERREDFVSAQQFWADEYGSRRLPERVEDLILYELHLGALGFHHQGGGTLKDAMELLDHIAGLNVNAIELLPLLEFNGEAENWGYATSHYFALEFSGGGRDQFKHFIKACHQRGIAVVMDVVYNHFDHQADRAERYFDSPLPERDFYYWYEGRSEDYRYLQQSGNDYWKDNWYRGGYIDNMSTGDSPAFHQDLVRKLFISSAVALINEFHVDGFRVDQTTSMHAYNKVRATGREAGNVNIFGAKFLREFGRTLRLIKPAVLLMAEDHSEWVQVTTPVQFGGMGFDARWYSEFYHHLSGDTNSGGKAQLLRNASLSGSGGALQMDWFSGALQASSAQKVVYNESHDEAGNSEGPYLDSEWKPGGDSGKQYTSERSINVAVNMAPLFGATRDYAEARCRFAWGVTVLSAGTPMFLFGEEVGAEKRFKYNSVLQNREDLHGMRQGSGRNLYRFYSDINALRLNHSGLRSRNIGILATNNQGRVIAFRRWNDNQSFLVLASLADTPYASGYVVQDGSIEAGTWREIFNSDSRYYGGQDVGNGGAGIHCDQGRLNVVIPHAGFVVLAHERNHGS
ncbi:MAG: alpha amylase C-terminal domain-containing protein [Magnetococcales bacterium]|nr:alpha amylase C-terminal domain-containing protein [Magnetococcales bacterium]MBF0182435.1 alpha amylase C-terminal domain-containing protein [Magnetococcales bacterium]